MWNYKPGDANGDEIGDRCLRERSAEKPKQKCQPSKKTPTKVSI
jgi:hypothetical protein